MVVVVVVGGGGGCARTRHQLSTAFGELVERKVTVAVEVVLLEDAVRGIGLRAVQSRARHGSRSAKGASKGRGARRGAAGWRAEPYCPPSVPYCLPH